MMHPKEIEKHGHMGDQHMAHQSSGLEDLHHQYGMNVITEIVNV
jgi:hypothetical protein